MKKRTMILPAGPQEILDAVIPFNSVLAVTGVKEGAVPSGKAFAKAQKLEPLSAVFDLQTHGGTTGCALYRMTFTIPRTGTYTIGSAIDYWSKLWVDGAVILDLTADGHGRKPMDVTGQMVNLKLQAGKHTLDVYAKCGTSGFASGMCAVFPMAAREAWEKLQELGAYADFSRTCGPINKMQHGCNSAPNVYTYGLRNYSNLLRMMNFTTSRTHDWALFMHGERVVDTHFIFPLMHLDPKDIDHASVLSVMSPS